MRIGRREDFLLGPDVRVDRMRRDFVLIEREEPVQRFRQDVDRPLVDDPVLAKPPCP
jgi:hypothetical protein